MTKEEIEALGKSIFENLMKDLQVVHGINSDIGLNRKSFYEIGLKAIKDCEEDHQRRIEEERIDKEWLDSLEPEFRQYILLKRKYEPSEMGDW